MPYAAIGRTLIVAAAFAVPGVAAQTMYKWVDEKGTTHFSEKPPPDEKLQKKATKVEPKVIPPGRPDAYDPNAWKTKQTESKRAEAERGQKERVDAKDAAKRAERCERARTRVSYLKNTPRLYRDHPDGTRTYFDEKEREAEIEKARDAADEACR